MKKQLVGAIVILASFGPAASSADDDVPNGCSLGLAPVVQHGLDDLVLKACTRHDICWNTPGTCAAPTNFSTMASCDFQFWLELKSVCWLTGQAMKAAGAEEDERKDFKKACYAAAFGAYIGVSFFRGTYAAKQCAFPTSTFAHSPSCSQPMCDYLGIRKACCPRPKCTDPHIATD